jgi:hypothetical protein
MWTYNQKTGEIRHNGKLAGKGYAGYGGGKNNPAMESVKNIGPVPRGKYTFTKPALHPKLGPAAMEMIPDRGNKMFGRSEFFMHSDSRSHPGEASHGCIVCDLALRQRMWDSGDHVLEVICPPIETVSKPSSTTQSKGG